MTLSAFYKGDWGNVAPAARRCPNPHNLQSVLRHPELRQQRGTSRRCPPLPTKRDASSRAAPAARDLAILRMRFDGPRGFAFAGELPGLLLRRATRVCFRGRAARASHAGLLSRASHRLAPTMVSTIADQTRNHGWTQRGHD